MCVFLFFCSCVSVSVCGVCGHFREVWERKDQVIFYFLFLLFFLWLSLSFRSVRLPPGRTNIPQLTVVFGQSIYPNWPLYTVSQGKLVLVGGNSFRSTHCCWYPDVCIYSYFPPISTPHLSAPSGCVSEELLLFLLPSENDATTHTIPPLSYRDF